MNKLRPFIFLGLLITLATNAQQPKLMLPIGHTDGVRYAQFSPDGKRVVTASDDKTAKIWDVETGALLADLKGHTGFLNEASFSPDGKKIITYSGSLLIKSEDSTARIWDALTGAKLADLKHKAYLVSGRFSPDGKRILTVSRDNLAIVWDAKTYQPLFELKQHKAYVNTACYSADGKRIITASSDFSFIIWDAANGKFIKQLKSPSQIISAQFSNDGNKVLTVHQNRIARVWNLKTDTVIHLLVDVADARFDTTGKKILSRSSFSKVAKLWDVVTGKEIFYLSHDDAVLSVQFSPDGKKAITASFDGIAKIWDIEKKMVLDTLEGHDDWVQFAQFSKDGKRAVTASTDGTAIVWQTNNGERLTVFKGHTQIISTARYSGDGERIVTASYDASAKIWDAFNGELLFTIKGHTGGLMGADFSPDGKKIITASSDSTAQIWDAEKGVNEGTLKGHTNWVLSAQYSHDGKNIVTASKDRTAKVWNARRYKLLFTLEGHTHQVNSAEYSPDGKLIVTSSNDSTAKIWDADDGRLLKTLKSHQYFVTAAHFSPDGKKIVTSSFDKSVKVWDVATGSLWQTFFNHANWVNDAVFSPDSKKIISASEDGYMKIWEVASSRLIGDIYVDEYGVNRAVFSPDGKNILLTSWSNICRIMDAERTKLLYSFFPVDSTDYLVADSNYRYDGTQGARNLLYFTCGTEVIELSQVKDELWVPGLAEQVLAGVDINSKTLYQLGLCGYTPQTTAISSNNDEYRFRITPRGGGLGETVVSVNGIEAKRIKPNEIKKVNGQLEVVVKKKELDSFMVAGKENPVEVKSFTANNAVTSRGGVVTVESSSNAAALASNLYAVMVGVSDYKGDSIDLKFAAKDANDMSNALGNAARKHLNKDGKEHVFIYKLTTNTDRYLLPDKKSIKAILDTIGKKATANDIFLIFFAGHGTMAGPAGKQQFYFLTSDAASITKTNLFKDVAISSTELTEWMKPQKIKAQKRVLVFDACSSGQAINDFSRAGAITQSSATNANKQKVEQVKTIDKLNEKSGFFILSASASGKDAYEIPKFSQGLLTYSLLRTIKVNPEILEDNQFLNIGRWFNVAEKTVTDLIKENNLEQEPQIVAHNNFSVGVVDEEVMRKIVIPVDKPLFTGTGLINSDPAVSYDDLELGNIVNGQLNNIAAKSGGRKISFLPVSKSPDAYSIRGQYSVKGDAITVIVNIIQNKKQKLQISIPGDTSKLDELALEIAMRCSEWAITNK